MSLNSQKIEDLADPTSAQDAVTLTYLQTNYYDKTATDGNYYADTTPLNDITAPNGDLSLNSHKITNLANPTTDTDALNRQTGDSRYYLATTPLNSITAPTGNVSANDYKITNLAAASDAKDAIRFD